MIFSYDHNWGTTCSGSYSFVKTQDDYEKTPLQYGNSYYISSTKDRDQYLGDWHGAEDWSDNPQPDRERFKIINSNGKTGNVNFEDEFWIQTNQSDPNCFGYRHSSVNWKQEFCKSGEESVYGKLKAVAV
jgi:hypothetical protein